MVTYQGVAAAPAVVDALSEILRAVRLDGSVFIDAHFTSPWHVVSPAEFDRRNLAQENLRHQSLFHLVTEGSCWIQTASGEKRTVKAGEVILLPYADEHHVGNGPAEQCIDVTRLYQVGPLDGVSLIRYGGGGELTRIVCGWVKSSEVAFSPFFRTLPELIIERTADNPFAAQLLSTITQILGEVDSSRPGSRLLLGRLMELLFIEVLRRHISRLPEGTKGWFGALNDPIVGRALQLIHRDPGYGWTMDALAKLVGASRSVLAERFKSLLGRPPMDYVTNWRIQVAGERIRAGQASIAQIASDVGYDSEAAFNRAFKRVVGLPPGQWRNHANTSQPAPAPYRGPTPPSLVGEGVPD